MPPANKKAAANAPRRRTVVMPPVEQIRMLSEILYKGGMSNKNIGRPEQLAVRIIAGYEVGLTPIQSVNNIMVVNGRACIWGDAALALVRASGAMAEFAEGVEGDGDARVGWCRSKRAGTGEVIEHRFSVEDAKTADLWGKDGPWTNYPQRMLHIRPRAWVLRDLYTDILAGLGIVEEQMDVPPEQPPRAAEPVAADATPTASDGRSADSPPAAVGPIAESLLRQIGEARPAWLRGIGVNPDDDAAVKAAWLKKLGDYATDSAKKLDAEAGGRLLAELRAAGNQQEIKEIFPQTAA